MGQTIREQYLKSVYAQYPNLKMMSTAVESMTDWYLRSPDDFKRAMKSLERDAKKHPPKEKPNGEIIVECVSKKDASETDPVPDNSQQQTNVGKIVELHTDHPGSSD
jgi:hypothetical protein